MNCLMNTCMISVNKLVKICIGLLILISSCSETTEEINFTLYNDTDNTILLRAFKSTTMELVDAINLKPNSKYTKTQSIGFDDTQSMAFYSDFGVDSVRIIFNSNRVVIYTLYEGNNTNLDIFYGNNKQYHVTDVDFSMGINCIDDCE